MVFDVDQVVTLFSCPLQGGGGGDSASGRRDVGQKWEREAGGEVKSIWDVGG